MGASEKIDPVRKILRFGGRRRQQREELAFLPAALELVETPASPVGRATVWTIIAVFAAALAWACISKVDIVATATGKIIPGGRTKQIQPFEIGVVRSIRVGDGEHVRAGEVLIELDPTIDAAERDHLRNDLMMAELDIARLRASLSESGDPLTDYHPPPQASREMVEMQRQFLLDQIKEQHAKIAALDGQLAQKEAERATAAATVVKLEATLPVLKQRMEIRQTLYEHKTESLASYLELLQPYIEAQKDVDVEKSRLRESEAALVAVIQTRAQTEAEYRSKQYADLVDAERKAKGFAEDLKKAEERTSLQQLSSPVDGTVQQLAVHTVGGVVTPAQVLLVVVPDEQRLQVEAMVSNRDIGFVHEGQDAQIKVDTFNFTQYGLLHGKVLGVSRDAIVRDKPAADKSDDKAPGSEPETSEPPGQEMNYAARVSLDRTEMPVDNRIVDLMPGMAVTVEIKTGSRRVISYLLSPLLKFKQESLRER